MCYGFLESVTVTEALADRRLFLGLTGTAVATAAAWFGSSMFGPWANAASFAVSRTPEDWKRRLGPARFHILREAGTERAFNSPLLGEHRKGVFACAGCGLPLFPSSTKFDSGTGWPSFWKALPHAIATDRDVTLGMVRVEEHCSRCGGHLGHIFDDGPPPTGKRHCINGLALSFRPS